MMTFNACMFQGGLPYVLGGLPPASERLDELELLIRKKDPDILLLQEMAHPPSMKLYERIKDLYPHFFVRIGPNPPLMESGLFLASKHPIENAGFIPFEGQCSILRGSFWIETPDAVVFTSHMEAGEKNNHMRVDQLKKIKEMMATFNKPCFLLGDFNIDRYVKGSYEECRIARDFHDPVPAGTPTCTTKLEAIMRGTTVPEQPDEQDDYTLLLRRSDQDHFRLKVEIEDTYVEGDPYGATSDHKALVLTATKHRLPLLC